MRGDIYWTKRKFPGRIALVARPRGGDWLEIETQAWADAGLGVVVSMLEDSEIAEFELEREAERAAERGIEFILYPVADRGVPVLGDRFIRLNDHLQTLLRSGKNVGIHCRQSIGRAPLLAAALMVADGMEPAEAFSELSISRGRSVPETPEQVEWIRNFAHRLDPVHS